MCESATDFDLKQYTHSLRQQFGPGAIITLLRDADKCSASEPNYFLTHLQIFGLHQLNHQLKFRDFCDMVIRRIGASLRDVEAVLIHKAAIACALERDLGTSQRLRVEGQVITSRLPGG